MALILRGALTEPMVRSLHECDVGVGVSIDGTAADHDRNRRHVNGRGSHTAVHAALRLLSSEAYRQVFAGILCTVDPTSDPVATYDALVDYDPPMLDFLLPHAHWSNPPVRPPTAASYGDWLCAVFDRYYQTQQRGTSVRLFDEILNLILGGTSRTSQVGTSPVAVVVLETDGAVEQDDALKSTYPGAASTGYNVLTHPLSAALRHPGVVARQIGVAALAESCGPCSVRRVCGGGHYAHRYHADRGFRNPSVYCFDLRRLITHIRARVVAEVRPASGIPG